MFSLKLMCSNVFRAGLSRLTPSGLFKPQGGEQAVRAGQPQGSILFEGGQRSFHSKTVTPTYSVSNVTGDCSKGSLPALGSLSSASLLNGFMPGGVLNWIPVRTNIRNHFPRPKENKRIKVHGWKTRMSTPGGRRVIMRRILKGRHILSHDIINFVK